MIIDIEMDTGTDMDTDTFMVTDKAGAGILTWIGTGTPT
jgi:hypothetical protein